MKLFKYLFVLLLFLFSLSCSNEVDSNDTGEQLKLDQLEERLSEALEQFDKGDLKSAEVKYQKLRKDLTYSGDTIIKIKFLFNYSELLKAQARYKEALENYFLALKYAQLKEDQKREALANYNIATVLINLNKIDQAYYFNHQSEIINRRISNKEWLMKNLVLKASIDRIRNRFAKAHLELDEVINYSAKRGDDQLLSTVFNNKGNLFALENKKTEALLCYKKSADLAYKLEDKKGLAIRLGNIAEMYLELRKLNIAETFLDSSSFLAQELGLKETQLINLERKTNILEQKGDFKGALSSSKEMFSLKVSIMGGESNSLLEQAKENFQHELQMAKAKNRIKLLKKNQSLERSNLRKTKFILYLVVLIVLVCILAFIVYLRKQREVEETRERIKTLENQRLKDELKFKRQELTTFSLSLNERERIIESIKKLIKRNKLEGFTLEQMLEELNELLLHTQNDGYAEIFNQIEKVNSSFTYQLKSKHPNLTEEDVRLATLLVLGSSSKEIAQLFSIEVKSVEMKRYRLKKKLGLSATDDLISALNGI